MGELAMAAATPYDQVVEDMVRGRDCAAQLQSLLRDSPEAGSIVDEILHVFSRAIDAARAMARGEEGSEVQSEVTCAGGKRKASGGDRKGSSRRRTQNSSSVKMVTTKELEDGHAWRKYGQKEIGNCKYPRAYFRCTHKYDQRCMAQRQVQRSDDAPDMFKVTYIGAHTCQDPATLAPPLAVHVAGAGVPDGLHAGSRLISFVAPNNNAGGTPTTSTTTNNTTGNANNNHNHHQEGALLVPPLKLEGGVDQEEVLSSLTPTGSARNPAVATPGPDQGDVTSDRHFFAGDVDDLLRPAVEEDMFDLEELFSVSDHLHSW